MTITSTARTVAVVLLLSGSAAAACHAAVTRASCTGSAAQCSTAASKLARALERCTAHLQLIACDDALHLEPNDPGILVAEADVLVQLQHPGEAVGVFRNALLHGADAGLVNAKIAAAEIQRRSLFALCETATGTPARRACDAAWLPGARDEVAIFERRGFLLQADDEPSPALDAYMAAARLRPGDRDVAQAIVRLSAVTGRQDAATLAARGAALIRLHRPAEAIAPLRKALHIAPDLPQAQVQLRAAERLIDADRLARAARAVAVPRYTNLDPTTRSH